jgi:hypothetical protein
MALKSRARAAGLIFAVHDDVEHEVLRIKHAAVAVGTAELVLRRALVFPAVDIGGVNDDGERTPRVSMGPPAVTFVPAGETRAPIGVAWVRAPARETGVAGVPAGFARMPARESWVTRIIARLAGVETAGLTGVPAGRAAWVTAGSRMEPATVAGSRVEPAAVAGSRMEPAAVAGSGVEATASAANVSAAAGSRGLDEAIGFHRLSALAVEELFRGRHKLFILLGFNRISSVCCKAHGRNGHEGNEELFHS